MKSLILLTVLVPSLAFGQNNVSPQPADDQTRIEQLELELANLTKQHEVTSLALTILLQSLNDNPVQGRRTLEALDQTVSRKFSGPAVDRLRMLVAKGFYANGDRFNAVRTQERALTAMLEQGDAIDKAMVASMNNLSTWLADAAHYDDALIWAERALENAPDGRSRIRTEVRIRNLLESAGRFELCRERVLAEYDNDVALAEISVDDRHRLLRLLVALERADEALPLARAGWNSHADSDESRDATVDRAALIWILDLTGEIANAPEIEAQRAAIDKAAVHFRRVGRPLPPEYADYLISRGEFMEAEYVLRPRLTGAWLQPGFGGRHVPLIERMIRLYTAWGKDDLRRQYQQMLEGAADGFAEKD